MPEYVKLFVKVSGKPHSQYRSAEGIFHVEVLNEQTPIHNACAAIATATECVPFLAEAPHKYMLDVFDVRGVQIKVPREVPTQYERVAAFYGRASDYPTVIESHE